MRILLLRYKTQRMVTWMSRWHRKMPIFVPIALYLLHGSLVAEVGFLRSCLLIFPLCRCCKGETRSSFKFQISIVSLSTPLEKILSFCTLWYIVWLMVFGLETFANYLVNIYWLEWQFLTFSFTDQGIAQFVCDTLLIRVNIPLGARSICCSINPHTSSLFLILPFRPRMFWRIQMTTCK